VESLADAPLRRSVAVIMAALAVVVVGNWLGVQTTTDYLLYENATSAARVMSQRISSSRKRTPRW
jgi:hypothetical protein